MPKVSSFWNQKLSLDVHEHDGVPVWGAVSDACVCVCTQTAKGAGRSLEFMKLSHNLAAVQRKKLDKIEAAYEIYQV